MVDLWEKHMAYEFEDHDENLTVSTMVEDAYVNHVPMMTGGRGREAVREFYGKHFVHCIPPDMKNTPISRTVGDDRLVDEMICEFTHTIEIDWMLPGIAPTGKKVKVAVAHFRSVAHVPNTAATLLGPSKPLAHTGSDRSQTPSRCHAISSNQSCSDAARRKNSEFVFRFLMPIAFKTAQDCCRLEHAWLRFFHSDRRKS